MQSLLVTYTVDYVTAIGPVPLTVQIVT